MFDNESPHSTGPTYWDWVDMYIILVLIYDYWLDRYKKMHNL